MFFWHRPTLLTAVAILICFSVSAPRNTTRSADRRNFLQWLLPGNVSYQNGAIKFIEGFYPVSEIVVRLKKAEEDKVQWRAEHAAAIERFWDFYKRESRSPDPPKPDEG